MFRASGSFFPFLRLGWMVVASFCPYLGGLCSYSAQDITSWVLAFPSYSILRVVVHTVNCS